MTSIPSDITKIEDARHWCRVNGFSVEATESMVAEWDATPVPTATKTVAVTAPVVEEPEEDEDEWEYEEESEDEE
jgi:hypothetical protein